VDDAVGGASYQAVERPVAAVAGVDDCREQVRVDLVQETCCIYVQSVQSAPAL
jgi:hypothetical protein